MNVELHSNVELQNDGNVHCDFEIHTHERDEELPDRDVHSDSDAERPNIETRTEPRLSKYMRRNHPIEKIIGNKEARPMTRNTPRIVNDALQYDDWYKAMK